MSKSTKRRPVASLSATVAAGAPAQQTTGNPQGKKADHVSKQSRLVAMLRSPTGTTIAAMMKTTGWQQHSVRGFLAGVVRKRLKLKLNSKKANGTRVYQVAGGEGGKSGSRRSERQPS